MDKRWTSVRLGEVTQKVVKSWSKDGQKVDTGRDFVAIANIKFQIAKCKLE